VIEEIQSASEEVLLPSGKTSSVDSPSSSSSGVQFEPVTEEIQSAPEEVSLPSGNTPSVDDSPSGVLPRVLFEPAIEEIQSASEETLLPLSKVLEEITFPMDVPRSSPDRITVKVFWRNHFQFYHSVKEHFDPDSADARSILTRMFYTHGTPFTVDNLVIKTPTKLEHNQMFRIIDDKESKSRTPYKPVKKEYDRNIRIPIYPGEQVHEDHELDGDPEIDILAQYGCDPHDLLNDSDGYVSKSQIPRTIMLTPTKDLSSIWNQVESKFRISREHFNLVSNSHYLDQEGVLSEKLEFVEIRFKGKGAGPYMKAPLVHPSHQISVQQVDTNQRASFRGAVSPRMMRAELKRMGWTQPVLSRQIGSDSFVIPDDEDIVGGTVDVYSASPPIVEEELEVTTLRGVIKEGSDSPEEIVVRAQTVREIKSYIESLSDLHVRFLWCGIHDLNEPETKTGGLVIDVEYQEITTAIGVQIEKKQVWLPFKPWEELFE
jgi:hypothetical protein